MTNTAKALSAAELVKLAEEAATEWFARSTRITKGVPYMCVYEDGLYDYATKLLTQCQGVNGFDLVFCAPLTPENVASPLALKRALLASAIVVEPSTPRSPRWFFAKLGGRMIATPAKNGEGPTPEIALSRGLDALLASPPPVEKA
ncbi:MAG: hypothetical protein JWM87_775 [Candidatus Eremiobacteraeota bacterium]|nr:hypothetical protein [Candidatus Eremiobacteraeota bacterium]